MRNSGSQNYWVSLRGDAGWLAAAGLLQPLARWLRNTALLASSKRAA
jgi:hypothetical protein